MAHEHENQWQSYPGVTYTLQGTTDFVTWVTLVDKRPGDGSLQSHVDTLDVSHRYYRLIQEFKEGAEPLYLKAYTAWDGTYVQLEWNSLGPPVTPTAHFKIIKNGTQLTTVPYTTTSYKDTAVSSAQRYTYSVGYYK